MTTYEIEITCPDCNEFLGTFAVDLDDATEADTREVQLDWHRESDCLLPGAEPTTTTTTKGNTQETRYRITNNNHGTNWTIGTIVTRIGDFGDYHALPGYADFTDGSSWGGMWAHESEVERID